MGRGVNKAILLGNICNNPELRRTGGGAAVVNIRLACDESRKTKDGWEKVTEFIPVVIFGKTAETICEHIGKGRQLYVEGRMQTSEWEDKEGNKRKTTEVIAYHTVFIGDKQKREDSAPQKSDEPPPIDDSEIPFM